MAQMVKVVNVGTVDYIDTYRDNPVKIPAWKSITMQRRDAIEFLGRMSPAGKDGKPVPKMLVIEPIEASGKEEAPEGKFICNLDGAEFDTQEELDEYLKKFASKTVSREIIYKTKRDE